MLSIINLIVAQNIIENQSPNSELRNTYARTHDRGKKQNPFAPSNKQSDLLNFDKGIHKNSHRHRK